MKFKGCIQILNSNCWIVLIPHCGNITKSVKIMKLTGFFIENVNFLGFFHQIAQIMQKMYCSEWGKLGLLVYISFNFQFTDFVSVTPHVSYLSNPKGSKSSMLVWPVWLEAKKRMIHRVWVKNLTSFKNLVFLAVGKALGYSKSSESLTLWWPILCLFTFFVQVVKLKLFSQFCKSKQKQFHVSDLLKFFGQQRVVFQIMP